MRAKFCFRVVSPSPEASKETCQLRVRKLIRAATFGVNLGALRLPRGSIVVPFWVYLIEFQI